MNIRCWSAALAALGCAVAQAQVASCTTDRQTPPEPLGDRLGHAVQLVSATCTGATGAREGHVTTIQALWEQDLAGSKLVTGDAIVRERGAVMAYHLTEGVQYPVMKDGRAAGWTATGRGIYTIASGIAASLLHRTFSWIARSTSAQGWLLELRLDD
jgi:hypothetical protein